MILDNFFEPRKKSIVEATMSPGSPALAAPKAPRAPAAPSLEEQDQPLDMGVVNQIYRNNKDVIGDNPNVIEPKTIIDLPDGTPYEVQPGDTLSKIARKMPAIKAATAASNKVVAEPSFMDKLKQAASGLAAGQFPSQAIPAAFPSLKKPMAVPVPAPAATTSGTIVYPDWSQTKYANLGPLVKGSDGIWRTQDGKMSAADPEIIAMADKLATSNAAPVVKKPPEKVAPADSLNPDEQIVVKSKVKRPKTPYVPTPRPTGKEPPPTATPTGIPAAAEKTGRVVSKVEKSAKQGIDWIGDKIADRAETRGSKSPYTQKNILGSSAYGRYQFMPDTFAGLVKLAKPGDPLYGKTFKDYKKDPKLQDETMKAGDVYYTDVLSRNKIPATDGNKYLSHFAGAENAVGILNLPTKTPLKDLYRDVKLKNGETIPNSFFTKNKFPEDMTAGDLRKWANAKMAEPPPEKKKQKTKESTVSETVHTVKVMLETATTRDDVRRIKDYIDRQYTRHGLSDSVSFAQRNHLVERVIEITAKRRITT